MITKANSTTQECLRRFAYYGELDDSREDAPVIESLLDNDFYAFTMGQFIWRRWGQQQVSYAFTNRDVSVPLAKQVDDGMLRSQLERMRQLRFTEVELAYLRSLGHFDEAYLDYLRDLELPYVDISQDGDQLDIRYTGDWAAAVFWEAPILATLNELYYRVLMEREGRDPAAVIAEGERRLDAKVVLLKAHPGIRISEFGTRRRFSRRWQAHVLERLVDEVPKQVVGTSNVKLAMNYGLKPSGTMAHQLFMVRTAAKFSEGAEDPIAAAQAEVMDGWEEEYAERAPELLVALPDTYGTETFLRNCSTEQAARWHGFRIDSREPVAGVQEIVDFYRERGLDPRGHLAVPSDGLVVPRMIAVEDEFTNTIPHVFGWGTNATNDLGLDPLKIVIKPSRAVKLSDNEAKAMGPKREIARYRRFTGPRHADFRPVTY